MQSNARRSSGKPPRSKRSTKKGDSKTDNAPNHFSMATNQRKHIIRVKVLGLAGVTVRNDSLEDKPSTKGGMKRTQKKKLNHQNASLPPPSSLKAVVAFSRNQKVKGASPPSLCLARSPTTPIILTGRQANMTPEKGAQTSIGKNTKKTKQSKSLNPFERYIAVWEDAPLVEERDTVFETTLHRALNTTSGRNTAETERITEKDNLMGKYDEHSIGASTATSTAFAPKSFDVTIALGDENYKRAAFSIGVATLAIAGDECVKTKKAKVVDLPILSLEQAQPVIGGKMKPWLPFIAMKTVANPEGDATKVEEESEKSEYASSTDGEEANDNTKKKNKRLTRFFRKKKTKDKPITPQNENESSTDSIKNLMTTAEEKVIFLRKYGIDPTDAVLRVSIEVYEKGSELQKILEENRKRAREALNPIANNMSFEINPSGEICQSRSKSIVESFSDDENSECENSCSLYGDSLTTDTGTYQGSQSSDNLNKRIGEHVQNKNVHSKFVLDSVLGVCTAPCVQKGSISAFLNKEMCDEISLDSLSSANSLEGHEQRNSGSRSDRHYNNNNSGKNRKSKSSGSPRSVNDPILSQDGSSNDSQTRSLEGNSMSYANSFNTHRSNSVMQTIKDVLQCSMRHDEDDFQNYLDGTNEYEIYSDDDDGPAPPGVIHSHENDSIGELTDITYDYEREIVKTKDLKLEVSPKLVLAQHGKALAGRVLLPAAFGGDGMCVSHGARLIVKDETKNNKKNKRTEDYERIFFRQQTELDPIQRSRLKTLLKKNDKPEHDGHVRENNEDRDHYAQDLNFHHEPFSDAYEVDDIQADGQHRNDRYENRAVHISKTTSEEERVKFENDKYGRVFEHSPIKQLREGFN